MEFFTDDANQNFHTIETVKYVRTDMSVKFIDRVLTLMEHPFLTTTLSM